jgi:hypothetical protein
MVRRGAVRVWAAVAVVAVAVGLGAAGGARAQTYTWTDENGRVHMTDDEHEVPAQYRKTAQKRESSGGVQVIPGYGRSGAAPAPEAPKKTPLEQALSDVVDERFPQVPKGRRAALVTALIGKVPVLIVGAVLCTIATLLMAAHAAAYRRPFWCVGHLVVGVTVPFYALSSRLDSNWFVKALVVAGWALGPFAAWQVHTAVARALYTVARVAPPGAGG